MSVIIIFVDGVGIGKNDPDKNPCLSTKFKLFSPVQNLPNKGVQYSLDACLNVDGFPQSATGQTTIYTGINAAQYIGKHLFGFPNAALKELLATQSIFIELKSLGYKCKFINAFRPVFFTSPELFKKMRLSVTSEMNRTAKLSFNDLHNIKKGMALYHDYTNKELIKKGFKIPLLNAEKASTTLVNQSKIYDLVLYEYFLTDMAGHSKDMNYAISELDKIEELIFRTIEKLEYTKNSLVVCSDHGNLENIDIKSHTLNPAYFAIWTKDKIKNISSLSEIKSLILQIVKNSRPSKYN